MMIRRYYRIPQREIGYLRFILESYDGLAFARTLDPRMALVEIAYPDSRERDAHELLIALAEEIPLTETEPPSEILPL